MTWYQYFLIAIHFLASLVSPQTRGGGKDKKNFPRPSPPFLDNKTQLEVEKGNISSNLVILKLIPNFWKT